MASGGAPPHRPEVLIAGLAPAEAKAAVDSLAALGLVSAAVEDAGDLLSMLAQGAPEALVVDEGLRGLSGPAICQVLRKREATAGLPIFLVTAHPEPSEDEVADLLASGASDVVSRPTQPRLLARRISAWIRLVRREGDLRRTRQLMRTLQRVAGIATWEVDPRVGSFEVSDSLGRLLGLRARGPVGVDALLEHVAREDRSRLRRLLQAAAETGESFSTDTCVRPPDGPARILSWDAEVARGEDGLPARLAGSVQDITERAEAEQQVRFLAYHDGLTGLENRHAFMERLRGSLATARRNHRAVALLFLDLDNFKRINDTLGHAVGDLLLKAVAGRLDRCLRASDLRGRSSVGRAPLSRLGGDEFTVVVGEVQAGTDAARVARRILDALREPFAIAEHEVVVGGSIGITVFPNDGEDVDTLLRNADVAMYEAKAQGRNTYQFFSRAVSDAESRRLALEERLRRAVEEEALKVLYQPQVEVRSGRVIGGEALLRWNDPDLGPVSPSEFIPVAEGAGLIVPIGEWVLGRACAQAAAWRDRGLGSLQVAVNVSARHFASDALIDVVGQALFDTGLAPEQLILEITEHVFSSEAEVAASTLRELKRIGVRIALDDFGTGYSSLGYLKRFPVDQLKIDHSFVRDVVMDPDDAAITEAIVSMARALRLGTVAEGVETVRQREILEALGCSEMQGYLFSPPVTPEAFAELLRQAPASWSRR